jgi:predicted dehydrogenase
MKDGRLGVCIVGCGMMGTIHAQGWQRLPDARVVAVVDILEERAQKLAAQLGLSSWHSDFRAAIASPEVDVVSVCIPTNLHAEVTLFAANLGKHILCEKPIALRLEDAQAMIEAAQRAQVKLGIGFMRRHSPVLEALRDWIAAGHLGRPLLYQAFDVRQIRPKLAMHDAQQNGGPVVDMAVHLFDTWSCIFESNPVEIYAQGLCLACERPELASIQNLAPDTASILARYASGDQGSFTVTWGLPPGVNPPGRAECIYGSKGMAEVVFELNHQELRWMKEGGEWETIASNDENCYQREIASMARHILDGTPYPSSGADGLVALRAALAALHSIQSRQPEPC